MNIKDQIQELLNYLGDEDQHFWECCTCSDEVIDSEDFSKCTCEDNKHHIYREVVAVQQWLNSPSCPLVDDEELNPEELEADFAFRNGEYNKEVNEYGN